MEEELKKLPAIRHVYDSDANFLLVKVDNPDEMYDYLIDSGVIVRNRTRVKGCNGCLRITIGTPDENKKILKLIQEFR